MNDEGKGAKLFDFGAERRKREEAAADKAMAAAHPDSFAYAPGAIEALSAQNYRIASRAVNELSQDPDVLDNKDTFWAHAESLSSDQLAVAVSKWQDNKEVFLRDNGAAKAYAIMARAREVFAR